MQSADWTLFIANRMSNPASETAESQETESQKDNPDFQTEEMTEEGTSQEEMTEEMTEEETSQEEMTEEETSLKSETTETDMEP